MKAYLKVFGFVLILFLLVGCKTTKSGDDPICPPDFLVPPLFVAPANLAHVNTLTPTLEWTSPVVSYPYSSTGTCRPEKFRLTLKKGPLFMEAIGAMVDGTLTSWTTPPLEAGVEYRWSVSAMSDNTSGPYSGTRKFFVGENCSTSVIPPVLLQPFNGQTVFGLTPTFVWQNPSDCIPFPYRIEIATDQAFANILQSNTTSDASTSYTLTSPLPNCSQYFWRVAASAGTDLETFSDIFTFSIATEGCEAIPGAGSLSGLVWRDICTLAEDGSVPIPMPFGCQPYGDHGAIANGNVDPGEPGIADIIVHIGAGPCDTTTPLGIAITNSEGRYSLPGLQAGTYCVSIDPAENPIWLGTGWWTYPQWLVAQTDAKWQVDLAAEEDNGNIKFGWQAENGTPNPYNFHGGYVFNDICDAPQGVAVSDPLPAGCVHIGDFARANNVFDSNESGIPGVEVELHQDSCDGTLLEKAYTNENGYFYFMIPPGRYCAIVRSQTVPNEAILMQGQWSAFTSDPNRISYWMNVDSSLVFPNRFVFGWDFARYIHQLEFPLRYPIFKPDFEISCRAGPDVFWQKWAVLQPEMEFEIKALNLTRDWVLLQPAELLNPEKFPDTLNYPSDLRCWVRLDGGTYEGDLGIVPINLGPAPAPLTPDIPANCSNLSENVCKTTDGCKWVSTNFAGAQIGVCQSE